jgi:hypothetical protein
VARICLPTAICHQKSFGAIWLIFTYVKTTVKIPRAHNMRGVIALRKEVLMFTGVNACVALR